MPTLWFGGSFNPIHHAHLICARAVAEAHNFDRVVLVPSAQPPHKPAAPDLVAPEHRLQMCRLAVADDPLFEVDDLELHRTGPSYTIDTVRTLRARGHSSVTWLIGADMLAILPTWHQVERLLTEARLLLMARPGWTFDFDQLPPLFRSLQSNIVEAPLIDISATSIRHRLAHAQPVRYLLPTPVATYLTTHRLYQ